MRLCHLLQQDSGGSLSNGGKEGRRQRARRPVFEDRWQKKGVLVGRRGAALVGVEVKNAFPEGGCHLDLCPCLQIGSVQQAKGPPYPLHTSYETLGTYAPSKIHADIHINPPPSVLFTPPFFTLSAVFERKMREEKKARERVQCQGRAVEKTSFLPACCSEWVIEVAVI